MQAKLARLVGLWCMVVLAALAGCSDDAMVPFGLEFTEQGVCPPDCGQHIGPDTLTTAERNGIIDVANYNIKWWESSECAALSDDMYFWANNADSYAVWTQLEYPSWFGDYHGPEDLIHLKRSDPYQMGWTLSHEVGHRWYGLTGNITYDEDNANALRNRCWID